MYTIEEKENYLDRKEQKINEYINQQTKQKEINYLKGH